MREASVRAALSAAKDRDTCPGESLCLMARRADFDQQDGTLTQVGHGQISQLIFTYSTAWKVCMVISSTLRRGFLTAQPIAQRLGVPHIVCSELNELSQHDGTIAYEPTELLAEQEQMCIRVSGTELRAILRHVPEGYSTMLIAHLQCAMKTFHLGLPRNSLPVVLKVRFPEKSEEISQKSKGLQGDWSILSAAQVEEFSSLCRQRLTHMFDGRNKECWALSRFSMPLSAINATSADKGSLQDCCPTSQGLCRIPEGKLWSMPGFACRA